MSKQPVKSVKQVTPGGVTYKEAQHMWLRRRKGTDLKAVSSRIEMRLRDDGAFAFSLRPYRKDDKTVFPPFAVLYPDNRFQIYPPHSGSWSNSWAMAMRRIVDVGVCRKVNRRATAPYCVTALRREVTYPHARITSYPNWDSLVPLEAGAWVENGALVDPPRTETRKYVDTSKAHAVLERVRLWRELATTLFGTMPENWHIPTAARTKRAYRLDLFAEPDALALFTAVYVRGSWWLRRALDERYAVDDRLRTNLVHAAEAAIDDAKRTAYEKINAFVYVAKETRAAAILAGEPAQLAA